MPVSVANVPHPRPSSPRGAERERIVFPDSECRSIPEVDVDRLASDLWEYYDQEARLRAEWDRGEEIVVRRSEFVRQLGAERRRRVLEVGCGTGSDAAGFVAADLRPVGIDLSLESLRFTSAHGVDTVRASVLALPFTAGAFDAAWTMSTLVHVPDDLWDQMCWGLQRVLVPGSPVAIGVWGSGTDQDDNGVKETDLIEPKRMYYRRSDTNLLGLLDRLGVVEAFAVWRYADSARPYQYAMVRTRT